MFIVFIYLFLLIRLRPKLSNLSGNLCFQLLTSHLLTSGNFIADIMSSSQDFLIDVLRSHGIDPARSSVLDIGTGNGKFSLELANMFQDVITIDSDGEAVRKINEKISSRKIANIKGIGNEMMNINVDNIMLMLYVVLHISADELPSLGDNVFNVIIARNSLHFISNIPKLYDDMKFLLRSHGIFVKISSPLFDLGGY